MIERAEVQGKMSTICYFDDDWKPRHKDEATMCKVISDDLEVCAILRLRPPPSVERKKRRTI
jgi:hypothetical protein